MKNHRVRGGSKFSLLRLILLIGTMLLAQFAQAETITIGKGTGIIWEGLPFNAEMTGRTRNETLSSSVGTLVISNIATGCMSSSAVNSNIGGFSSLPISPGIGLVPRADGFFDFMLSHNRGYSSTSGTIGLPETTGRLGYETEPLTTVSGREWCLPTRNYGDHDYYQIGSDRTVRIKGTWVIVADGTQVSTEVPIPPMYAASFSSSSNESLSSIILPSNTILRVSTLDCQIIIPTEINFGSVKHNTQNDSELASQTDLVNVTCSQDSSRINTSVNLQFRAISGLFGDEHRLALSQRGGYITGEISNNVTNSGVCNQDTGIAFDSRPYKIGDIKNNESKQSFNNQITWRLCSGGESLPFGQVTAAADILVTFN